MYQIIVLNLHCFTETPSSHTSPNTHTHTQQNIHYRFAGIHRAHHCAISLQYTFIINLFSLLSPIGEYSASAITSTATFTSSSTTVQLIAGALFAVLLMGSLQLSTTWHHHHHHHRRPVVHFRPPLENTTIGQVVAAANKMMQSTIRCSWPATSDGRN